MNNTTLNYLINCEIFSITKYTKNLNDTIWNREVLMSRKIIENNWNIGSLLPYYKDVDFTFSSKIQSKYNIQFLDDIMFQPYLNRMWNVYKLVFIKGNRVKV